MTETDSKTMSIMPWLVAMAFFMQMLDSTILNTAIPSLAEALHESPLRMQAVVISYTLTVALLIPLSGWLADTFGTRRVFCAAVGVFTLGSLLCAMSTSLETMIAARVVQGIGGANMAPVGRLAILRAYPRSEFVRAMSFITMPGLIGPLVGPTVGGLLVEYASWHWIFLINIPVGVVGSLLSLRYLPNFYGLSVRRFDFAGFLLFGVSMILISFAAAGLGELHLSFEFATLAAVGGIFLLFAYVFHATHSDHPLLNLNVFRNKSFSVGMLGNAFSRTGSSAMPFVVPLMLQIGFGLSPAVAGLYMIPMTLASFVAKAVATPLLARFGYRRVLTINTILLGALIASLGVASPGMPVWLLLPQLIVFGGINSTQFTAMNTLTLVDLDEKEASDGNCMLSITMQVAASFGVTFGAGLLDVFSGGMELGANAATIRAFNLAFIGMGLGTVTAAVIFLFTPREAGKGAKVNAAGPH